MTEMIRNRIYLLANGKAKDILTEMVKDVEKLESTIDGITKYSKELPPNSDGVLNSVQGQIKAAGKIATSLMALEVGILDIERKPGIKRYHQLQAESIDNSLSPAVRKKYRTETQSLKATYSRELTELVSKTHQSIIHRLNLIQYWKSMVFIEIRFYEALRNFLLQQVMSGAQLVSDPEFQQMLLDRLSTLQGDLPYPEPSKVSKAALQVSNMNFLKETLCYHLDEVVRLEKTVMEKKEVLVHLEDIAKEISQKTSESAGTEKNEPRKEFPLKKEVEKTVSEAIGPITESGGDTARNPDKSIYKKTVGN